jgi:cobalt-zinc-cadmium efflux system outer membrane protein
MNRHIFVVLGVVLISISSVTASEERADENSLQTLSDYLRVASVNNAQLKGRFEEWKAALEQVPQAKALEDPKFTYTYFIEEIETRVGPQKNKFGIMQVFPWFGTIEARTDAASAKAKAARQRYEAAKLKLFREVKDAFYEFSYLAVSIDIAKENLELLQHFEEIARTQYRTAAATHPDIIRAQIELAKLEDILKSLVQLKAPTVANLNSALNRPVDSELSWPKKEPAVKRELNRRDIIATLIRTNPELAELGWEIEAARSRVELAKKKFYPNIGVGVDWIQTGDAVSSGNTDSGRDAVALMFSMNIPLWQDSYKAAERQARANVRKVRQEKIDAKNKTIAQALKVLYDVEDTQRKMNLYGDTLISKAEELVYASETAYKAGTVDFLSLVDAQRMLLKYRLDYERAITNNQQNLAELEMLVGVEL